MSTCIFVIGNDESGEFGIDSTDNVNNLIPVQSPILKHTNIDKIYSGHQYSIYNDKTNNKWYSSGNNMHGSCIQNKQKENKILNISLIEQIQNENITIKHLFVSPINNTFHGFIITTNNKIFGFGDNKYNQLGIENKNESIYSLTPIQWKYKDNIKYISCSHYYSIALTENGDIYANNMMN